LAREPPSRRDRQNPESVGNLWLTLVEIPATDEQLVESIEKVQDLRNEAAQRRRQSASDAYDCARDRGLLDLKLGDPITIDGGRFHGYRAFFCGWKGRTQKVTFGGSIGLPGCGWAHPRCVTKGH
jgi:hypothetical protein